MTTVGLSLIIFVSGISIFIVSVGVALAWRYVKNGE